METIETLISESEIAQKVSEIADCINNDYAGREIYLVGMLNGAVFFMADLARKIKAPVKIGFMDVSSYDGTESGGVVNIDMDLNVSVEGKNVLIVEDIVDTGRTLSKVVAHLKAQSPAGVRVCALLNKPERRVINDFEINYTGFVIPNKFVIGYGLDYDQKYRNLPYIGVLNLT